MVNNCDEDGHLLFEEKEKKKETETWVRRERAKVLEEQGQWTQCCPQWVSSG